MTPTTATRPQADLPVALTWQRITTPTTRLLPRGLVHRSAAGAIYTSTPSAGILAQFDDGEIYHLDAVPAIAELAQARRQKQPGRVSRGGKAFLVSTGLAWLSLCFWGVTITASDGCMGQRSRPAAMVQSSDGGTGTNASCGARKEICADGFICSDSAGRCVVPD